MSLKINKVYTENPYVDELVYYTQKLGLHTILKNEEEALNAETLESMKAGELYCICYEGTAEFWRFESYYTKYLTEEVISEYCHTMNKDLIYSYVENPKAIPYEYREELAKYMTKCFLRDYIELNPYYRMLQGLPPIGDEGLKASDYYVDINGTIDISKRLHELNDMEIDVLDKAGSLDRAYNEDPEHRGYILFLTRKIDSYTARRAARFDPIYIPVIESTAIREMYIDKLEQNKAYTLKTIYSDAFKYNSDYYDNFICVFIVLITMIDIISRVQEFITKKEIFDIRSCKYLFQSFGVPYFEQIPLKYQINMVKNIHTLLKYKSTAKCMVDICTLFGYNNIKIFKYYLIKDRSIDINTKDFTFRPDENENGNDDENFTLKFLKLPLEADLDEYIRVGTNYIDYDQITYSDPTWDGGLDHEMVRQDILKEEFNYTRTKYISIDTVYDITKFAMQQAYFFGILYDNHYMEENVAIHIPFISINKKFRVSDIFTLLTILTYKFNGIKDTIMDTHSKTLYVHGFNFKADLAELSTYLKNTADNLIKDGYMVGSVADAWDCLNKFINPEEPLPSFNQMMDMFVNNFKIRDLLVAGMEHADNLRIFLIFKKLYDTLMITELNMDYYMNPETGDYYRDNEGDPTYTEFLRHREPALYNALLQLDDFEDDESKTQYIANFIDNIVSVLELYIDTKEFEGIFSNLTATSSEAVKQYIATVINFYKSYKVDFLGLNTVYYIDDKLDGIIRIIDDIMHIDYYYHKREHTKLYDFVQLLIFLNKEERVELTERIHLDITTWLQWWFRDKVVPEEKIAEMLVSFERNSYIDIWDWYDTFPWLDKKDVYDIYDNIEQILINFTKEDKVEIKEIIYIHPFYRIHRDYYTEFAKNVNIVYFEIPHVVIKYGQATVYDPRIKKGYNAQFIIDPSVYNLVERSYTDTDQAIKEVRPVCSDGSCYIHVEPTEYPELYGRLIIYYDPNEEERLNRLD